MLPAIFTKFFSILFILFFSISFVGNQLISYKGIFGGLNITLDVNYTYKEVNSTYYIVTVKENGKIYNTTLDISSTSTGYFNYTIQYIQDKNTLVITYYSSNYSNVLVLMPIFMPFNFSSNSIIINIRVINGSKIASQIFTTANITHNSSTLALNYSDLNLTADPVFFSSARYVYYKGVISYFQSNYSITEFYEKTTLYVEAISPLSEIPITLYIGIAIVIIGLGIDIPLFLEYRKKKGSARRKK